MKIRREVARFLIQCGIGGAIPNAILMWLLFATSLGDKVPDGIKIVGPIFLWAATMAYLVSNIKNWFPRR
jgi:hypothetical protein